eukprot:3295132-Rhodomonas_salina.3
MPCDIRYWLIQYEHIAQRLSAYALSSTDLAYAAVPALESGTQSELVLATQDPLGTLATKVLWDNTGCLLRERYQPASIAYRPTSPPIRCPILT